jgi:hypothetical protein
MFEAEKKARCQFSESQIEAYQALASAALKVLSTTSSKGN